MPVPSAPDAVPAALPHLTLAREALDRSGAEREDPGLLGRLAADPATGVLHLVGGRAPVRDGALVLVPPAGPFPPEAVFLGRRLTDAAAPSAAGRPLVLVARESAPGSSGDGGPTRPAEPTDAPTRDPLAGAAWLGLRDVAAGLSDADTGLFVEAVAIANWHAGHGFCSRCGGRTDTESAGWVRRCRDCSARHFPRTDPAVIMAVMDDQDRILLGSNAAWPAGRHSCLAGFVEPGESLEHAVAREVLEEAGIVVVDAAYRGSQPWPFPRSLMVGYRAHALPGQEPVADGHEIRSVRWFTRDELAAEVRAGAVTLPGAVSIARALIEDWYGGTLPDPTTLIS
ncbi:NAD(+) diphosphatase [Micrococcus porci]|uniref:NAD(+) diphosphatase n=1 Tax=Micrococcus porci TaxID=2856555 RepID=UPI001CD02549|nr:NAD(+) diphosphatase [Micrococcus porci]UBH23575.1 NAD(+) diphosphatase [Micrococcus porci]